MTPLTRSLPLVIDDAGDLGVGGGQYQAKGEEKRRREGRLGGFTVWQNQHGYPSS